MNEPRPDYGLDWLAELIACGGPAFPVDQTLGAGGAAVFRAPGASLLDLYFLAALPEAMRHKPPLARASGPGAAVELAWQVAAAALEQRKRIVERLVGTAPATSQNPASIS